MIITVIATTLGLRHQWQAELLHHSWRTAQQAGDLVRLVACSDQDEMPDIHDARSARTLDWSIHPFTQDHYPSYNDAASLMDWLYTDNIEATILLLEPDSILLGPIKSEIAPGEAKAGSWGELDTAGAGPFGLGSEYDQLGQYCSDTELTLPGVKMPLLIHSSDLKKLAPRWLELTGLIRSDITAEGALDASLLAYNIASAEFGVVHETHRFSDTVHSYKEPICDDKGKQIWQASDTPPWEQTLPEKAGSKDENRFLSFLHAYVKIRASGEHMKQLVGIRLDGVKEAQVVDQVILELPGGQGNVSLNSSAASIWKLINNERSIADIAHELEQKHGMPEGSLWEDVEATMRHLKSKGAINIIKKS